MNRPSPLHAPRAAVAAVGALLAAVITGCAGGSTVPIIPGAGIVIPPAGPSITYVAIGASDTAGVGADDPAREAWPQVLYQQLLGRAGVAYNLGVPGALAADAAALQAPAAAELRPRLVTIFIGVNDIVHGVDVQDFRHSLEYTVETVQGSGTTILLADIPVLHSLPAVLQRVQDGGRGCDGGAPCSAAPAASANSDIRVRSIAELDAQVDAYNTVIRDVAVQHGCVLVDLFARGDEVAADPGLVSDDGFHPSDQGHRRLAEEFAAALRDSGRHLS